ncbi:Alpha/beta hydrolase family-domain-containing protein [Penicillium waksmanii]|uniref:Alpha/beta hydrolase family-domain-containing protein n=1 Tax=Penicillium waksmanii TaxID=69791 RepID=UPI0025471416|nr:Alpha/beta hydrolase family-domain-containing protein [Penicillium waksmanii]KAJ5979897.1 Alpha/beta hydrolase family-domain-containing protein [Penicillium waksmanii]
MPNQPTLVFIHGSWHTPTCYNPLIKLLEPKLRCVAVSLPSTSGNPKATFKDDLDAARTVVSAETSNGRDVVVIAHSYGGIVGGSVIKGFAKSKESPASDNQSGYVIGLILIASGFNLTGLSFMDPFFGHPPPSWRVNNETGYAELVTSPRELFYHDLPDDEAEYWVSQLTTQSLKALFEGGEFTYAGWQDVPSWYIGTVEDHGLPVLAQRLSVGMAREMGGVVEHRELQTSHSPFLSQPALTARIILEAVAAFTDSGRDDSSPAIDGDETSIVVPRTTLFKPLSWFKFGIPMAFGRFMGRGFLLFGWVRRVWAAGPR